ncbi:MATE family efflux transporter [Eubacteriales bacterium OttesenSCG-928-K08]|nr:MATE family efflux transporter [Eubacteriales bacterium OttesenSCG-928-K08]
MRKISRQGLAFWSEFFRMTIPIILTQLLTSTLHIVDNIMVGRLGDTALASVAQANQLIFLLRLALFGIASGCSIFASQHWGVKDIPGIRRAVGTSMIATLIVSVAATVAAIFFPEQVMRIYTKDPEVILLGAQYLRIVGIGYIPVGLSLTYNAANRSTERVKINLVASAAAILCNVFFNWCFIFGNLGFPRLEVRGAAIATTIASMLEAVVLIGWTYYKKYPAAGTISQMKPQSLAQVKRFYKVAFPVIANECIWATGTSAYYAVYGRMSTQIVAAMNVFSTVEQVLMAFTFGIMNAASVIVGKRIGAGLEDEAVSCGKRMMWVTAGLSLPMGALLLLSRSSILSLFNLSEAANSAAYAVMGVAAFTFTLRSVNTVSVVGIVRSGGDAIFSMIVDGGSIWAIGVPLAILGGLVFKWHIAYVYLLIQSEELVKGIVCLLRFKSRKWMHNLVETEKTGAT